jgi:hypothetical protein
MNFIWASLRIARSTIVSRLPLFLEAATQVIEFVRILPWKQNSFREATILIRAGWSETLI